MEPERTWDYWIDMAAYDLIEARYPRDKDALLLRLTPRFCASLIERSERMIEWIKNKP
jgi:hypothetical protein